MENGDVPQFSHKKHGDFPVRYSNVDHLGSISLDGFSQQQQPGRDDVPSFVTLASAAVPSGVIKHGLDDHWLVSPICT